MRDVAARNIPCGYRLRRYTVLPIADTRSRTAARGSGYGAELPPLRLAWIVFWVG